ncbi:dihydrolipoyllysine-residue acetyltransferase [Trifolium repens]|jgi:hypothetical protein|nr:dihydrolipoyllysine-residue acetyltransferase [Trifolium repens]
MGFILKERLKWLKVVIKEWNKETYGDPNENKNELIADILALDNKRENVGLSKVEVETRMQKFEQLWSLLKRIDASIFQRLCSKWLKLVDANTTFFHAWMKGRMQRNGLVV